MLFIKELWIILWIRIATSELPDVSNMAIDFLKSRDWNDVIVIHSEEKFMKKFLQKTVNNMANIYVKSLAVTRKMDSHEIRRKVDNLNSVNRRQFLCLWDETVAKFMDNVNKVLFLSRYDWFILLFGNYSLGELKKRIIHLPFYIPSEVSVAVQSSETKWVLYEIWKVGPNSSMILDNEIGEWSENFGLKRKSLQHKMFRRKDMKGYHIRVATREFPAFSGLFTNKATQNLKSGYSVDVFHVLQEQLNFTYSAVESVHGSIQEDRKTWSGIVGLLMRDKVDVAVLPFARTSLRTTAMDFTVPVLVENVRLFIRRPELQATWVLYALPFDLDIWICLPVFVAVAGFFLWGLNKMAIHFKCPHHKFSVGSALWQIFVGLLQQTSDIQPFLSSGRLVMVASSLCSLILYTCYSSMLVSILTTMQPTMPFRSFDDLRKLSDWQVGTLKNSALTEMLQFAPENSGMRHAWENKVIKNSKTSLVTNREGMENILSIPKYAYFEAWHSIDYLIQEMPLDKAMHIVDTGVDCTFILPCLGLQLNSPFKEILNYYISLMTSRGQLKKLQIKWWPRISREPPTVYPSPGFNEAFTVFLTLGIGFVSSLACLGLEKIFSVKIMTKKESDNIHQNSKPSVGWKDY